MNNIEKGLTRRDFLKRTGLFVAGLGLASLFSGENQKARAGLEGSGLSSQTVGGEKLRKGEEVLTVQLSADTWASRLLAEDPQERETGVSSRQEEGGSYLIWRLPLPVEGCQEVRKYRTYQVFSENELGPHSCHVRAEVFYADWAEEGAGAWRVFVTGGNPSPGEWCSVLIADCQDQNSAKVVLEKLTEGGCSEGAWCININDCTNSGGEVNIPSIQACKSIEDICCRKQ
jgi:hypothetical protein